MACNNCGNIECCGDCTVPVELPTGPAGPQGATGNPGPTGNGISSVTDNGDGTFTFNFTDGSTFTTSDLTGPTGPAGPTGAPGPEGPPASIPTGLICMYTGPLAGAFSTTPADYGTGIGDWVGWALCNPNQTLNNGIYDKQDGTGTIQVPDLESKFIIGMDPSTAGATLPSSGEPADYSQSTQQNPALSAGEMEHRLQSNESGTNIHTHTATVSGTGKALGTGTYLGEEIYSHHHHKITVAANSSQYEQKNMINYQAQKEIADFGGDACADAGSENGNVWTGALIPDTVGPNGTHNNACKSRHIADGDHEHAVILGGTTVTVDPSAVQHASVDHENRPVYFVVAFVMKL